MSVVTSQPQTQPSSSTVQTTLYDLIMALQDEVSPDEDALVTAAVAHLMESGQLTFDHDPRPIHVIGL